MVWERLEHQARASWNDDDVSATHDDSDSDSDSDADDRLHSPFLWMCGGLVIAVLWVRPITSSLWNDEFGTWWVVSGDLHDVVRRAEAVQAQSPLYYLVAWVERMLVGHSEVGLRAPSLVFALGAAFLVYLIAERFFDRETARLAVIAFAVWPAVAFAASDARPYALGVFAVAAATFALIRWLDTGHRSWAVAFVLAAALIPYVHPIFGVVLIPLWIYAIVRVRDGSTPVRARTVMLSALGAAVLIVPIALELLALWRRREISSLPRSTTVSWLVELAVPPAFVGAACIAGLLAVARVTTRTRRADIQRSTLVLLVGWLFIPLTSMAALSIAMSIDLLEARYLICVAPAAAILLARLARSIEAARARRFVVTGVVLLSVLDLASPMKSGDFRGAARLVNTVSTAGTPVLVPSGFQESIQPDWFSDPQRNGLLTAATSFYPVAGNVTPLPAFLNDGTIGLVRAQVGAAITGAQTVVVLVPSDPAYGPWFDQYMAERGWVATVVGNASPWTVIEFTRAPS